MTDEDLGLFLVNGMNEMGLETLFMASSLLFREVVVYFTRLVFASVVRMATELDLLLIFCSDFIWMLWRTGLTKRSVVNAFVVARAFRAY